MFGFILNFTGVVKKGCRVDFVRAGGVSVVAGVFGCFFFLGLFLGSAVKNFLEVDLDFRYRFLG